MSTPTPLTTGQIAKYCGVNFRTVIRWIERGHLKAYKLPGRGDNRVKPEDFVAFLIANDMPVPAELQQNPTLLVVDDDVLMAKAIARTLRRAGYEVDVVHSGFEAGAAMVEKTPSLLTLDLNMPGMSGLDVLKHIRERFGDRVKVLIISGASPRELKNAISAGCDAVLEKPFANPQLLQHVEALVGKASDD